jgi:adenylate kinase
MTTHGFALSRFQEIFARRLRQFYATTLPLLQYYNTQQSSPSSGPKAKLVPLRGNTSDEIWPLLEHAVRSTIPSLKERGGERRRATFGEVVVARDDERRLHEPGTQDARRT